MRLRTRKQRDGTYAAEPTYQLSGPGFRWQAFRGAATDLGQAPLCTWRESNAGPTGRRSSRKFEVKGYTHHASPDDPEYEIKSSKTDHIAFHKGAALTRLGD